MRVLLDISDSDHDFIKTARDEGGAVIVIAPPADQLGRRACRGQIIGIADPRSVHGSGDRAVAVYDVTLLDAI